MGVFPVYRYIKIEKKQKPRQQSVPVDRFRGSSPVPFAAEDTTKKATGKRQFSMPVAMPSSGSFSQSMQSASSSSLVTVSETYESDSDAEEDIYFEKIDFRVFF